MNRFRSRSGPFEEQLRFSIEEIDRMCVDALRQAELFPTAPEPIRIERFIERHFACRVGYEDLGSGVMGCTIFRADGSVEAVIVSNGIDDGRESSNRCVRSTLAHEGGHALMHASLFITNSNQRDLGIRSATNDNIDFAKRRIMCRETDVRPVSKNRGYDGRWWEWQANRAIGGFLLPKTLVQQAVSRFTKVSGVTRSPGLPDANRSEAERELATIFEVNPIVARIRLGEIFPAASGQLEF